MVRKLTVPTALLLGVAIVCAGWAPPAWAEDDDGFTVQKQGDKTIKFKKKTSYDFEGASIDGVYNKPAGSYISNIKDVKARSIIKVRENFDAEVLDSARHVR
jgi:hypothetical protein